MRKHKYKVGDIVIGVRNNPNQIHIDIVGKIGKIISNSNDVFFSDYRVEFMELIDSEFSEDSVEAYWDDFTEDQIKPYLTKLKLKKLLKDNK